MANLAEHFNTLIDSVTGAGEALISRIEGEAAAGQAGSIGFSFKDSSGNVVLPQLNPDGTIAVSFDAGTCLNATGQNASGSLSDVDIATITLATSTNYSKIEALVSATVLSEFTVVWNDNASETVLGRMIVGPGQYTVDFNMECLDFTSGAAGTQELILRGRNESQLSCLNGTIAARQAA